MPEFNYDHPDTQTDVPDADINWEFYVDPVDIGLENDGTDETEDPPEETEAAEPWTEYDFGPVPPAVDYFEAQGEPPSVLKVDGLESLPKDAEGWPYIPRDKANDPQWRAAHQPNVPWPPVVPPPPGMRTLDEFAADTIRGLVGKLFSKSAARQAPGKRDQPHFIHGQRVRKEL